jgi:hypothetical protein
MKKLLILSCTIFFVVFGNAQKLRDDVEITKPETWVIPGKSDTMYSVIISVVEATKCAQNTIFGKPEFYTYLNGDSGKKLLGRCLSEMSVDTLNCEVITDETFFDTMSKDEFSAFYIKTIKRNGEYVQIYQPFYREQKIPYTGKKPKVFIDYFSEVRNSDFMNIRVRVKR